VDAVTDATLYILPCEHLRQIIRDHHQVALVVLEHLAAEVRRLSDMVEDLALHTVRTRLARFLLAAHIGTVRDVVGRALRALADEGLIRRERGRLVVKDRAGLEREAMK